MKMKFEVTEEGIMSTRVLSCPGCANVMNLTNFGTALGPVYKP